MIKIQGILTGALVSIFLSISQAQAAPIFTIFETGQLIGNQIEITYTVNNASTAGELVLGFVAGIADAGGSASIDTGGGFADWRSDVLFGAGNWTDLMSASAGSPLNWQQFFGGINYPIPAETQDEGDDSSVVFFINYSNVISSVPQFDNLLANAIAPGSSANVFTFVSGQPPASEFALLYQDDLGALQVIEGTTSVAVVPLPSAIILMCSGVIGLFGIGRPRKLQT